MEQTQTQNNKQWIVVFIACFLGLVVDGMDLQMLSLTLPSLIEEFGITQTQAGMIGTFSLIGMAIGGISGGWLSDRFGRVRMATYMLVLFTVGTAALGLVQSYEQFVVIRFISAIGIGAEYTIVTMLMAEYVPTRKRTTILRYFTSRILRRIFSCCFISRGHSTSNMAGDRYTSFLLFQSY